MQKYTLVILSNAIADREPQYNDWYDGQHLPDVLKVPGFRQRQKDATA